MANQTKAKDSTGHPGPQAGRAPPKRGEPLGQNGEYVVQIDVPLAEAEPGTYMGQHVEARLTPVQGAALNRLFTALHKQGETLQGGRHVDTRADAMRWLLEQVSEARAGEAPEE